MESQSLLTLLLLLFVVVVDINFKCTRFGGEMNGLFNLIIDECDPAFIRSHVLSDVWYAVCYTVR